MALKDFLVCVDQTEDALVRLRLATDLAIRHGSHLTALYPKEWSHAQLDWRKSAELGLVSAEGLHKLDERIEASIEAAAERLRSTMDDLTRGSGVETELHSINGTAAEIAPQYARCADLCILGSEEPGGPASVTYTFSEHMLFLTGRPVVFVPPNGSFTTLGRHIAVAWNASRPAARSLNDALPLIERAERTTIIMINPSSFIGRHAEPPGARMVEHLKRHRATVDAVGIENVARNDIGDRLQAEARAVGADLIVAGAFGHPRLWEKILGGVTHDLMARMRLPVFMSH